MHFNITRGKILKPRITGIYGVPNVGKTTWAANAPAPLILQVEEGANDLEAPKTDLILSWHEFIDICRQLYTEEDLAYKTIVVDSLDALERLIWDHVVQESGNDKINNIEDFGYGKGYILALAEWQKFKTAMTALRDKGLQIVCIAHAHIKKYTPPESEGYDKYEPRFHQKAVASIVEWCDEFFFANFVVKTAVGTDGKTKGRGKGERILYCQQRPAYTAKNRLGMPEQIPMTWEAYEAYYEITPSQKEN